MSASEWSQPLIRMQEIMKYGMSVEDKSYGPNNLMVVGLPLGFASPSLTGNFFELMKGRIAKLSTNAVALAEGLPDPFKKLQSLYRLSTQPDIRSVIISGSKTFTRTDAKASEQPTNRSYFWENVQTHEHYGDDGVHWLASLCDNDDVEIEFDLTANTGNFSAVSCAIPRHQSHSPITIATSVSIRAALLFPQRLSLVK